MNQDFFTAPTILLVSGTVSGLLATILYKSKPSEDSNKDKSKTMENWSLTLGIIGFLLVGLACIIKFRENNTKEVISE